MKQACMAALTVVLSLVSAHADTIFFPVHVNLRFQSTVTLAPTHHPNVAGSSFLFELNRKLYQPVDEMKDARVDSVVITDIVMRDSLGLLCAHPTYRARLKELAFKPLSVADTAKRWIFKDVDNCQGVLCARGISRNNTTADSGFTELVQGVKARSFSDTTRHQALVLLSVFMECYDSSDSSKSMTQMGLDDFEVSVDICARAEVALPLTY